MKSPSPLSPRIEQIFVNAPAGWRPRDMERRSFIARRRIEKRLQDDSISTRSLVEPGQHL